MVLPGWEALLLLVATQVLQMVQQLLPLLRFDGYHLLADLAGVPDLYHRIRPTLLGLLPHRWSDPENRVLKPWARAVITLWVLVTIPMMALMLLALVRPCPGCSARAGPSVQEDAAGVTDAWGDGGLVDVAAHGLQVLGVVLPLLACALILGRIGLRSFRGLARWSRGSARQAGRRRSTQRRRHHGSLLGLVAATGHLPADRARGAGSAHAAAPGRAERSGQRDAGLRWMRRRSPTARALPVGAAAERRLASGAPLVATFPEGKALPTKADPQLAIVLVPTEDAGGGQQPAPDDDRPSPGSSRSTSRCRPRRGTTRPWPSTPPTAR